MGTNFRELLCEYWLRLTLKTSVLHISTKSATSEFPDVVSLPKNLYCGLFKKLLTHLALRYLVTLKLDWMIAGYGIHCTKPQSNLATLTECISEMTILPIVSFHRLLSNSFHFLELFSIRNYGIRIFLPLGMAETVSSKALVRSKNGTALAQALC